MIIETVRARQRTMAEVRALGLDPLQVLITVSDRLVHLMLHDPMVYAERRRSGMTDQPWPATVGSGVRRVRRTSRS